MNQLQSTEEKQVAANLKYLGKRESPQQWEKAQVSSLAKEAQQERRWREERGLA